MILFKKLSIKFYSKFCRVFDKHSAFFITCYCFLSLSLPLSFCPGWAALLLVYRLTLPLIYNNCHACAINKKFVINRADAGVAAATAAAAIPAVANKLAGKRPNGFLAVFNWATWAATLIACQRRVSKTRVLCAPWLPIKNMICWLQGRTCCCRMPHATCHMWRHCVARLVPRCHCQAIRCQDFGQDLCPS